MITITFNPQISERVLALAERMGKTPEQIISNALESTYPTERAIPELSQRDKNMIQDIENKTNYNLSEFYQRWGIETE